MHIPLDTNSIGPGLCVSQWIRFDNESNWNLGDKQLSMDLFPLDNCKIGFALKHQLLNQKGDLLRCLAHNWILQRDHSNVICSLICNTSYWCKRNMNSSSPWGPWQVSFFMINLFSFHYYECQKLVFLGISSYRHVWLGWKPNSCDPVTWG